MNVVKKPNLPAESGPPDTHGKATVAQPHPVEVRVGEPLFSSLYNDHYFSRHDGLAETRHVFLAGNRLEDRFAELEAGEAFKIGELGFGTGLNFLATWELWRSVRPDDAVLHFTSVEGHPISANLALQAHEEWCELASLSAKLIESWDTLPDGVWIDDQTHIRVVVDEAAVAIDQLSPNHNAWFLDGFSPAKNPAMWNATLMGKMAEKSARDATFASYTAAGWVRRNLEQAGFAVVKQRGFGTKRDMIIGHLIQADESAKGIRD